MAEKISKFQPNDNDRLIVSALKGTDGLTIAEVNEKLGSSLLPVHFNHAFTGGFIDKIGSKEVIKVRPREVGLYAYSNSDIALDSKGNACTYSDSQMSILEAASKIDGEFTLSSLAEAMGVEKVAPGSVTALVKRGNLIKSENKATVTSESKSNVVVWGFVKDVE